MMTTGHCPLSSVRWPLQRSAACVGSPQVTSITSRAHVGRSFGGERGRATGFVHIFHHASAKSCSLTCLNLIPVSNPNPQPSTLTLNPQPSTLTDLKPQPCRSCVSSLCDQGLILPRVAGKQTKRDLLSMLIPPTLRVCGQSLTQHTHNPLWPSSPRLST